MSRLRARRADVGLKRPVENAGAAHEDRPDPSDDLERRRESKAPNAGEDKEKPLDAELDQQEIDDSSLLDALDQ